MKTIKFLSIVSIGLMLASCGGKKEESNKVVKESVESRTVTIPTSAITLEGEFAEYFEIDGDSITLTGSPASYGRPEVVTEMAIKPAKNFDDLYGFQGGQYLQLTVYGDNGSELGTLRYYSYNDIKDLEKEMKTGTKNPVKVKFTGSFDADEYNKLFDNAKSAKLNVNIIMRSNAEMESSSSDDNDDIESADEENDDVEASSSSSNEWDSILDEYESYVNKLISISKKAKQGDATAIAEMAEVSSDCVELSDKISNAKSDMTSAQSARYIRIQNKYANAMR